MNYDFHFGEKIASWKDIETVYQQDSKKSIKLTKKHIDLNGFQKMKVKYATQVLSKTMASSIMTYVSLGLLPAVAAGTAELLSKLDNIFYCLNSSSFNTAKTFKKPITEDSPHHSLLDEMLKLIPTILCH
jgi:hypothetical protein